MKAKFVIHAVGPVWHGGKSDEQALLADAYRNSLELAFVKGLRTVAFPSISTGAYGYPIVMASQVAISTVKGFLEEKDKLERVIYVLFSSRDLSVYRDEAAVLLKH